MTKSKAVTGRADGDALHGWVGTVVLSTTATAVIERTQALGAASRAHEGHATTTTAPVARRGDPAVRRGDRLRLRRRWPGATITVNRRPGPEVSISPSAKCAPGPNRPGAGSARSCRWPRGRGHVGSTTREFVYDAADRLSGFLDTAVPGSGLPASPARRTGLAYDGQDRLSGAANAATQGPLAGLTLGWSYDVTGNRRAETRNGTPTLDTTDPASNRLTAAVRPQR